MNIRALAVVLVTTCGLWSCTQAPPQASETESALRDEQAPATATPATAQPTPSMSALLLSGTPGANALAVPPTCHMPFTCDPNIYGSCGSWSPLTFCGDTCTKRCCHDSQCNEPDIGGVVYQEQFQDCRDAQMNGCTSWASHAVFVCGC